MGIPKVLSHTKLASGVEAFVKKTDFGHVYKEINYPKGSQMANLGIDRVEISSAGKQGKHIMAFRDGRCILAGKTKPECECERSVIKQMRKYIKVAKQAIANGFSPVSYM